MWAIIGRLLLAVALAAVAAALSWRRPPRPDPAQLDDFGIPRAEEGSEIAKIFGTVLVKSPQIAWYGDLDADAIVVRGPRRYGLFGPRTRTVTGYRYSMGMHMVPCLGPVDSLMRITYDKRQAWIGTAADEQIQIDEPTLFGARDREGGIAGPVDVLMGGPEQDANDYLASAIGAPQPAYRGVTSLIWRQVYWGNQPSIRPVAVQMSRIVSVDPGYNGGAQWYPERAPMLRRLGIEPTNEKLAVLLIRGVGAPLNEVAPNGETFRKNQDDAIIDFLNVLEAATLSNPPDIRMQAYAALSQSGSTFLNATAANFNSLRSLILAGGGAGGNTWYNGFREAVNTFFDAADQDARRLIIFPAYYPQFDFPDIGWSLEDLIAERDQFGWEINVVSNNMEPNEQMESLHNAPGPVQVLDGGDASPLISLLGIDFDPGRPTEYDMNPAHILRELVLSPDTGGSGVDADAGESWVAVADTLTAENLGLSDIWANPANRADFKERIERHIDGRVYQDRRTGLWEIRLIRDDYDPEELPVFDRSNVVRWSDITFPEPFTLPNQIVVTWTDPEHDEKGSLVVTDPARVMSLTPPRVIQEKLDYPAIHRTDLASRVAARDLQARSAPLMSGTFVTTYLPTDINLGSPIIVHNPRLGIENRIVRVLEIEDGDGRDNAVRVRFVEDRFALGDEALTDVEIITPPDLSPQPVEPRLVEELPYFEAVRAYGAEEVATVNQDQPDAGFVHIAGGRPVQGSTGAIIRIAEEERDEELVWSPAVRVWSALARRADHVAVVVSASDALSVGMVASIGNEHVRIDSIVEGADWYPDEYWAPPADPDGEVMTLTLGRGCLDTVPQAHEAGGWLIAWDGTSYADDEDFAHEDQVDVQLQTVSLRGVLPLGSAPVDTITMARRLRRPYPPGNLRADASYAPEEWAGSVTLTWAHRDRIAQGEDIVDHTEGDIGPEAGVTYTVRGVALDEFGDEIEEVFLEEDHASTSIEIDDYDIDPLPEGYAVLRWEVWSVRDGLASWQRAVIDQRIALQAPQNLQGQVIMDGGT